MIERALMVGFGSWSNVSKHVGLWSPWWGRGIFSTFAGEDDGWSWGQERWRMNKWYVRPGSKVPLGWSECMIFPNLCFNVITIWMFPKIGVPQNGWFVMEIPIKLDDLGVRPFSETPIYWMTYIVSWPHHQSQGHVRSHIETSYRTLGPGPSSHCFRRGDGHQLYSGYSVL